MDVVIGNSAQIIKQAQQIRYAVFVQEQSIPQELDLDGLDQESMHLLVIDDSTPVATARLSFPSASSAILARVAVMKAFRGAGVARAVIQHAIDYAIKQRVHHIDIHAHQHLRGYYENFGFEYIKACEVVGGHPLIAMSYRTDVPSIHLQEVKGESMSNPFMLRALEISQQALPKCRPNPPVGCVLVKDNQIVAEGHTQAIGGNHAEVEALNAYRGSFDGVTAYVTLEPCSFVGRTPACAKTLVSTGIKHVVVAMLDPDPRNSGKGIAILEDAGIKVDIGVEGEAVSQFLTPYLGQS